MLNIFTYYFIAFGKNVAIKNMNIFMAFVCKLDINNQYNKNMDAIRQQLKDIYKDCQYYMN